MLQTFMVLLGMIGSKSKLKTDKKTYQMDFRNSFEVFREVGFDINEGADMIMVKPGMFYLDLISKIKKNFNIPVLAYQVSGEYSLIKNGIQKILNEEAIMESILSFKRAGACAIITYFALEIAKRLNLIVKIVFQNNSRFWKRKIVWYKKSILN